jgi:PAS domain-containing protein
MVAETEGPAAGLQLLVDELHASETRYRRLFEAAKDGILILDARTGEIDAVNPFLADLLGYPAEDIIGKKLWEIGPFQDSTTSKIAFHELQSEQYIRYDDLPSRPGTAGRLPSSSSATSTWPATGK